MVRHADALEEAGEHVLAEFYRLPLLLTWRPEGPSFLHFVYRHELLTGMLPTQEQCIAWMRGDPLPFTFLANTFESLS